MKRAILLQTEAFVEIEVVSTVLLVLGTQIPLAQPFNPILWQRGFWFSTSHGRQLHPSDFDKNTVGWAKIYPKVKNSSNDNKLIFQSFKVCKDYGKITVRNELVD